VKNENLLQSDLNQADTQLRERAFDSSKGRKIVNLAAKLLDEFLRSHPGCHFEFGRMPAEASRGQEGIRLRGANLRNYDGVSPLSNDDFVRIAEIYIRNESLQDIASEDLAEEVVNELHRRMGESRKWPVD
jgi:hypothetical protein